MKRISLLGFLGVLLLALVAVAAVPTTVQRGKWSFMAGVGIGSDVSTNRISKALAGSGTIDFASQTITCNTGTVTVTGAVANDVCFVSPGTTGGAANSSFSCYVSAADTVTVKHCPAGTASDPASQTYYVRVFSAQ